MAVEPVLAKVPPAKERTQEWFNRRLSELLARYRLSENLTDAELRTVEALMVERKPLRQYAREEGVSAQAISERINGLQRKAPEFWQFWRRKNLSRQLRRRRA